MRVGSSVKASTPAPPVRVDVLGALRLTVGGEVVRVPGPKRGAVLAMLAMADDGAVAVDALLDALWADDLPETARATLHSHVSRLRGHLGPAGVRLEGRRGGYRLRLDGTGSGTDVAEARSLLAAAKVASPGDGVGLLREARSLWRGPPLAEFGEVAPLAASAVTLTELRRSVDEAYATCALEVGAVGDAVEVATALAAADPLSETSARLLMRALAATGRPAEALRVGHDHRRRLVTEAGLDPSPALTDLERHIAGTTTTRAGRVARPATRMRGRDAELTAIHRLLPHERLVTVLGPGGVGKTRLAAEIAARAEQAWSLLLAPVTDPAAIPDALADALDLRVVHGDVVTACAALLGAGPNLLIIDNCEHVLTGLRETVATLLATCPHLTVLATSREPIGLPAEQRFRLSPLPLTPAHDLDSISGSPAVAMFVDRARRVLPDFAPSVDDLRLVAQIVRRLDGLPLAIELAAGRLSSLDLADLDARLDRALDLLGDGSGPTLRQTVAWSYDLLPEPERRLFRHLGAFPAGFDLAVAEFVAAALSIPGDPASALAHLVDASMIEAILGAPARYRMLDTIGSFASDRLEAEGEDDAAAGLFLRWALDLVAWVERTIITADEGSADAVLRRELANLRAAWRLVRRHNRLNDAVRIAVTLGDIAGWRDLTEVWSWVLELGDDPAVTAHPDAAAVLGVAAGCAWSRGELDRAEQLAHQGLALAGTAAWECQSALALVALSRGDLEGAVALGVAAAARATRPDSSLGVAALANAYRGHMDDAATLLDQMSQPAATASPAAEGFRCYVTAEIAALNGQPDRAEAHYDRAIALARESGATFVEGIASVGLLTMRANAGRVTDALDGYRDLLDYWERTGGWIQQWTTLRNLARLLRSLGDEETAVFLEAAANAAPDAPTDSSTTDDPQPTGPHATIRAQAETAPRSDVLDTARAAIARHRNPTSRTGPGLSG